MNAPSVVVGSPVQQRPAILERFLDGLRDQIGDGVELSFVFIDDNHEAESSALLADFARSVQNTTIVNVERAERYECDDATTHRWKESLVWRVAEMKDAIIEHALEVGADHLFFVDSDIVLHPGTIKHLTTLDKDVVSEVFWTTWTPGQIEMPQVWLYDTYDMVHRGRGEELPQEEANRRALAFIDEMRRPGVYEVGGLGACTLISREALQRGARFAAIPNLSFWGEDRHFCIRASALGLRLHADTHMPPLHLYRESDLDRLSSWRAQRPAVQLLEDRLSVKAAAGV